MYYYLKAVRNMMEPSFLTSFRGCSKAHKLQLERTKLDVKNFSLRTSHPQSWELMEIFKIGLCKAMADLL